MNLSASTNNQTNVTQFVEKTFSLNHQIEIDTAMRKLIFDKISHKKVLATGEKFKPVLSD